MYVGVCVHITQRQKVKRVSILRECGQIWPGCADILGEWQEKLGEKGHNGRSEGFEG